MQNYCRQFMRRAGTLTNYSKLTRADLPPDAVVLQINQNVPGVYYAKRKFVEFGETDDDGDYRMDIAIAFSLGAVFAAAYKYQHIAWKARVRDYYKEMEQGKPDDWEETWEARGYFPVGG